MMQFSMHQKQPAPPSDYQLHSRLSRYHDSYQLKFFEIFIYCKFTEILMDVQNQPYREFTSSTKTCVEHKGQVRETI